jgi:putative Mg2+ transporter-C (MgtC) family protein
MNVLGFVSGTFQLDWRMIVESFLRILMAFALVLPIEWLQRRGKSNLGLRTFPIVAMASCGFALIAKDGTGANAETLARAMQGIVTGIGFIGGGAIVKSGEDVRGLVTAASIWNTGAVGMAVAYEREEIAIVLAFVNFIALLTLTPFAERKAP